MYSCTVVLEATMVDVRLYCSVAGNYEFTYNCTIVLAATIVYVVVL